MTTFQKLGTWLKGQEYAQLTCVLVPDDTTNLAQTTWTLVVDAKDLYHILTSEGQLHYHQSSSVVHLPVWLQWDTMMASWLKMFSA